MQPTILTDGRLRRPRWIALALVLVACGIWLLAQPPRSCQAGTLPPTATPPVLIYLPLIQGSGSVQICFDAGPLTGDRPLTVRFTDTSLGVAPPYTAAWDFGDGQTGVGEVVTHTYTAAGVYSVTLALETRAGTLRHTERGLVTVSEPDDGASFTATPRSGASPLIVEFTDTTVGQSGTPHYWTFGDGTSSAEIAPHHTYTETGQYTVTLTLMTDGANLQHRAPNFITVYPAPVPEAIFGADVTSGTVPLKVKLTDTTPGMSAYLHRWDFGDGQEESTHQVPWVWHTYTAAGQYTVTLAIQAPGETISGTRQAYIHVQPPDLPVSFTATPRTGGAPLAVSFTNTTPDPARYQAAWDFGDGATSSDSDPRHVYAHAGSYTVTLTMRDTYGSSAHAEASYITVDPRLVNVPVAGRSIVSDAATPLAALAGQFDPYPPPATLASGSVVFSTAGYTVGRAYLAAEIPELGGAVAAARLRLRGCRFATPGLPASTLIANPGTWAGALPDTGAGKTVIWPAFDAAHAVGTVPAGEAQNGTGCLPGDEITVPLDPAYVRPGQVLRLVLRDSQDTRDLTQSYPVTAEPQGRGLNVELAHLDAPGAWLELTVR
jgi:PKD repeat protein